MAEFCLKCFNKVNGTDFTSAQVWLKRDYCESCGDWKLCVIALRPKPLLWRLVDAVRSLAGGSDKSQSNPL